MRCCNFYRSCSVFKKGEGSWRRSPASGRSWTRGFSLPSRATESFPSLKLPARQLPPFWRRTTPVLILALEERWAEKPENLLFPEFLADPPSQIGQKVLLSPAHCTGRIHPRTQASCGLHMCWDFLFPLDLHPTNQQPTAGFRLKRGDLLRSVPLFVPYQVF